jgi:hypothetical protein
VLARIFAADGFVVAHFPSAAHSAPRTILLAAFVGAAIDVRSASRNALTQRLRLSFPSATAWISAVALSGFMYGGNWEDIFAVAASWLALWKENNRRVWAFAAILIATFRQAECKYPSTSSAVIRFFDASGFYHEFFDRFGPKDFMGIPLHGLGGFSFTMPSSSLCAISAARNCGCAVMCFRAKNSRSEGPRGLST